MQILLSIFLFVIIICVKNYESKKCPNDLPFLTSDVSCSDFSSICHKSDDECKRLLSACKQCPPNNLTISYLNELIKTAKDTSNSTRLIYQKLDEIYENKFNFSKMKSTNDLKSIDKNFETLFSYCKAILVISSFVFVVMLVENRFKLITKCCKLVKDRKSNDKFIKSRKRALYNELIEQSKKENNIKDTISKLFNEEFGTISKELDGKIGTISKNLDGKIGTISKELDGKIDILDNLIIQIKGDRSRQIKFTIVGEDVSNEFRIYEYDSVVYVKDQICTEWLYSKENIYKIMKLKCGDIYLKDNDYLLSQITNEFDTIKCEFDHSPDAKKTVVLQIKGIQKRNVFLQLVTTKIKDDEIDYEIDDEINKLKDIIEYLIKRSNFYMYLKKDGKFTEIQNDKIFKFKDKDLIYIVFKEQLKLNFTSIFDETSIGSHEFSNTDKVQKIYDYIKDILRPSDTILISNSQYLYDEEFIFQYNFSTGSPIKYCKLIPLGDCLKSSENSTIMDQIEDKSVAYDTTTHKKVYVRKYMYDKHLGGKYLKENKALINELSVFDIIKSENKFVKFEEPYIYDPYLYIPIEHMKDGSVKQFLDPKNKNKEYVNEKLIINWSKQIVDAIDFLHRNNIIHRNLKTSNILLYEENKLKLSSFGLSKYLHDPEFTEMAKGFMQTNYNFRHVAPEKIYGNKTDIWSFGIVLLEMNNGESIFPGKDDLSAMSELANAKKNEDIKYSLREDTSDEFKGFIRCCLEIDPAKRSTAEKLKKHDF